MAEQGQMVDIYIMGRHYQVPEGLTILTALEYCGYRMIRGCGCRAGFCGACATDGDLGVCAVAGDSVTCPTNNSIINVPTGYTPTIGTGTVDVACDAYSDGRADSDPHNF